MEREFIKLEDIREENTHSELSYNDTIMENEFFKSEDIKEDLQSELFYCSKCNENYKSYCLKCTTLSRILNKIVPFPNYNSESKNIPINILEIRETCMGKEVLLLRSLPKDVIFGPFEGISGIESTEGYSWKIIDKKLVNITNGNWMEDVACAASASLNNLDIFQNDGNLYYRNNREILEGEELLIYFNDEEVQHLYTPCKEKLPKVFACSLCCLGFGTKKCLMNHKSKCPHAGLYRNIEECALIECDFCKIWLEKWEYQEYHKIYCEEKSQRPWADYSKPIDRNEMKTEVEAEHTDLTPISDEQLDGNCANQKSKHSEKTRKQKQPPQSYHKRIKNANETKKFKCLNCSYQTKFKYDLHKHLNTHSGIKSFQCGICMMKFTQKFGLNQHVKNIHRDATKAKEHKCPQCSFRTNYKSGLRRHLSIHNDNTQFKCEFCGNKFRRKATMLRHIKDTHKTNEIRKSYKCSKCSYQTYYKSHIKLHSNRHNNIKPFECDVCKAKFTYKHTLIMHIKSRHTVDATVKDYKCTKCSFQTNYKQYLKRHMNVHIGGKPYECDICRVKFTLIYSLKTHIKKKHTQNKIKKEHKCPKCTFETHSEEYLKRHMNTHSDNRPYRCNICTTAFTQKSNLNTHMKRKHSEDGTVKNHKCSQCSYETIYMRDLKRHLFKHSGVKPFHCDICLSRFTNKSNLKKHMIRKHAENMAEKL